MLTNGVLVMVIDLIIAVAKIWVVHDIFYVLYLKGFSGDLRKAGKLKEAEERSSDLQQMKAAGVKQQGLNAPVSAFPTHLTGFQGGMNLEESRNPLATADVARALTSAVMQD
ncbi:hypothetical protein HDU93_004974 [Gonapodya sp. JEL0774]|nr:hypothetical protein HDU93_004974 [Gonapodya sp. JEL0774]